jgi:hypothetical protein
MTEKILIAIVSGLISVSGTLGIKAVNFEGRMSAIEHSLERIESKLERQK